MDQDLRDLLAAWLGEDDPGEERRAALLVRLRADEEFRGAFVAELRLLGMLKAVQSPEPRWLRLEDEVGWSAEKPAGVEALAQGVVSEWGRRCGERQRSARRRRMRQRLGWVPAAAAACFLGALVYLALRPGPANESRPEAPPEAAPAEPIATVIQIHGVQWETAGVPLREGDVVRPTRLRLRAGRLTLAFFSGVSLTIEGPADLQLLAADRVFFQHGKLRARVLRGGEGFTVATDRYEVVDLGTEFAMNREPGGKSRVMVFEGEAAVSVLGKDGHSVRGALVQKQRSIEVDPDAGAMHDVPPQPEAFVPLGELVPAPLELAPGYAAEVLAAKPRAYWRFESLVDGRVPNEITGGPSLRKRGGVTLERSPGGNRWARFRFGEPAQAFLMEGLWTPPRSNGYAIELWVQADLPSRDAFGQTALVSLIARDDRFASNHVSYLELAGRGRRFPHEPCAIRFLDRWPAAMTGGSDVFSRRTVVPCLWHHLVGQKNGQALELYVDGERVGTSPSSPASVGEGDPGSTACRLIVGRLKLWSMPPDMSEIRPFEGRLDELALYDRPLTAEEISCHARLGHGAVAP
jgi:hypothetical protein